MLAFAGEAEEPEPARRAPAPARPADGFPFAKLNCRRAAGADRQVPSLPLPTLPPGQALPRKETSPPPQASRIHGGSR